MTTMEAIQTKTEQIPSLDTKAQVVLLNDLIAMCYNGASGYELAATRVTAEPLATLLADYAQQRAAFAEQLREEVLHLGGTPEIGGDLAGSIHRLWIKMKRFFVTGDAAMIAECLAGDTAALEVYEGARQAIGPGRLEPLVEEQYEAIRAARDRLQALKQTVGRGAQPAPDEQTQVRELK
jgi:uncharacterized protein (TIGR02284 family)